MFDGDDNNNNLFDHHGYDNQTQKQEPEEYILKIQITKITRAQLCSLSRDESNGNGGNEFALRGNLGRGDYQMHGILSDLNNNMQHGTIYCITNNKPPYPLSLHIDTLLPFCTRNDHKNGKKRNTKRFYFQSQFEEDKPISFQIYDFNDIPLSNHKFQTLIVYKAERFQELGTNLTINNNGIVSFPNANVLNISSSNISQKFDTIHVNNAYIAQAIVDQLQVLSDSELKIIQTDTPFPDDVLEQVFGLNLHIYKWISNGNLDAGYIAEDLLEIGTNLQIPLIHYENPSIKVTRENMNDRVIKDESGIPILDKDGQKRIKKGRRLVVNSNAIRALLIRSIQNLFSNQKELSIKMNEHLEGLKIFYYDIYEKYVKLEENIIALERDVVKIDGRVDELEQQQQNQQKKGSDLTIIREIAGKSKTTYSGDPEKVLLARQQSFDRNNNNNNNSNNNSNNLKQDMNKTLTKDVDIKLQKQNDKILAHVKKDDNNVEKQVGKMDLYRSSTTSTTILNDPGHWDFFIGHSRRSGQATTLAATLYHELTTKGYTVWLDVKMPNPATDAMKEGAQNCKLFLAIITGPCMNEDNPNDPPEKNAYFNRRFCLEELKWAKEFGIPIQPVVRRNDQQKIGELMTLAPDEFKFLGDIAFMKVDRDDPEVLNVNVAKIIKQLSGGPATSKMREIINRRKTKIVPLVQTNIKNNAALVPKELEEEILRAKPQNNNNNNNNNPSNAEVKYTEAIFCKLFQTHIMNLENLNNMIEALNNMMQIGDVQKIATKIGCKNININCLPERRQLLNTLRKICEEGRLANDTLTPDQRKKLDEYYNKYNNDNKINNIHIHGPAGSGKTYLALDFITKEIKRNSNTKILFVCTKNGFAKFLARWILIRIINTKEEDKSDDETKEDDATKYNPQYILNCIHFCTENTGYKAHHGILKQDSDDQPVYLHFDQIQDTDRVDEYNLIVVDEAHHIIHEKNKEWKQICRDFFYKAKKRIILTDPSQDPSNMNNIREKLAEAAAEEEEDDDQTMENIYNIELNDVVRSTQRIMLASHLFKHTEQTPTCKTKPFGEAVKMFMVDVQKNDTKLNAYVLATIEAIKYAKNRKANDFGFLVDLDHRVSIIIPSNDTNFKKDDFKTRLQSELNSSTKRRRRVKFELFSAEEMFGKFPQLEEHKSVEMVVDTISNQDGLEYDVAIVVGFGVKINELRTQHNKDKTTLYRAMTRAKDCLIIVNEPVKNGFFHSTITDTTFKDDESLKKQDEGRELVVPIRDRTDDYSYSGDIETDGKVLTKDNVPSRIDDNNVIKEKPKPIIKTTLFKLARRFFVKKQTTLDSNKKSSLEEKPASKKQNNLNSQKSMNKPPAKSFTAVFDTLDISELTKTSLGSSKYKFSQIKNQQELLASNELRNKYDKEFPRGTPIVCACEKGRFEDVKLLITGYNDVNGSNNNMTLKEYVNQEGKNSYGNERTPLIAAAAEEHFQIVKYLIEQGEADPNIANSGGYNALHWVAASNRTDTELIEFLLTNMSLESINKKESGGNTPLDMAYVSLVSKMMYQLENNYNMDDPHKIIDLISSKGGKTHTQRAKEELRAELEQSAKFDRVSDAKTLLTLYKEVYPKGTPIVCACEKGRFGDVKLLIKGRNGNNNNNMAVKEYVNQEGKDIGGGDGWTPLMMAARHEHFQIVKYLIEQGEADPNIADSKCGYNVLHVAAQFNRKDTKLIKLLLTNSRRRRSRSSVMSLNSINKKTKTRYGAGETPLNLAEYNKSPIKQKIIDLIRSKGGKLESEL